MLLAALAADTVLDTAYAWLCKQRRHWLADADVWSLRFHWAMERLRLQDELREGRYRFEPLSRVTNQRGEVIHLWSARDALVLKALALILAGHLPVSPRCVHVKGHGGAKAAVRAVALHLPDNAFVLRTETGCPVEVWRDYCRDAGGLTDSDNKGWGWLRDTGT